ncbi:MAG: hypothetical protein AAFQ67_01805, partial [Pseudomonadota bacterium]
MNKRPRRCALFMATAISAIAGPAAADDRNSAPIVYKTIGDGNGAGRLTFRYPDEPKAVAEVAEGAAYSSPVRTEAGLANDANDFAAAGAIYDQIGRGMVASPDFDGQPTAIGEVFDADALMAAHPTLPLPSLVQV